MIVKSAYPTDDELIPTRQSLLSRLKDWEDHQSWKEFFDTYWKLIYRTASKAGLNDLEAQEVVQDTMLSVARHMPGFKYREKHGSFKSWLLLLTRWRIGDKLRLRDGEAEQSHNRHPGGDCSSELEEMENFADPRTLNLEAEWDADWEMNLLEAALAQVKATIDPKMYQMFDCYVLKEWPVSRVSRALNVNATQVYLAKHRINRLVKKAVTRLREEPTFAR
jgi:RNA polymerase sigma factor (sigma-70 family)